VNRASSFLDLITLCALSFGWGALLAVLFEELTLVASLVFLGLSAWFLLYHRKGMSFWLVSILCLLAGNVHMGWSLFSLKSSPPFGSRLQKVIIQVMGTSGKVIHARLVQDKEESISGDVWVKAREFVYVKSGDLLALQNARAVNTFRSGKWYLKLYPERIERFVAEVSLSQVSRAKVSWNRFRLWIHSQARELTAKTPLAQEFLLSAVLGVKEPDHQLSEKMKPLGLSHIFTISGFHLSLWGLLWVGMIRLTTRRLSLQILAYALVLLLYALLVELRPSVLRALVFGILLFSGREFRRPVNPVRLLALVFWLHVLFRPQDLVSPAFHLTYGITAYLLWSGLISHGFFLKKVFWIAILHLLLCPYFLCVFGEYSLASVMGVLLSTPLGIILAAMMLMLCSALILGNISWFYLPVLSFFEGGFEALTMLALDLDYRVLVTDVFSIHFTILFYLLVFLCMVFFERRRLPLAARAAPLLENFCRGAADLPEPRFREEFLRFAKVQAKNWGCPASQDSEILDFIVKVWIKSGTSNSLPFLLRGPVKVLLSIELEGVKRITLEASSLAKSGYSDRQLDKAMEVLREFQKFWIKYSDGEYKRWPAGIKRTFLWYRISADLDHLRSQSRQVKEFC
jgi:ComEC/Rec2-related protein